MPLGAGAWGSAKREEAPVSAMKTCPTCHKQWAAAFKFCPEDGTGLVALAPMDVDPTEPELPRAAQPSPEVKRARVPKEAMPEPASKRSSRPKTTLEWSVSTPDKGEAPTVSELPAAPVERELRNAPTVLQASAITPEMIAAQQQKAAAKPAPAPAKPAPAPAKPVPAAAEPASKGKKGDAKRAGFSETAWFMKAVDPSAVDPETGKVAVDEQRYQRDTTIPEEKRRRFSLGSKNEE